MEALIILFFIGWLISPIVLTILLIKKNIELNEVRKQLEVAIKDGRVRTGVEKNQVSAQQVVEPVVTPVDKEVSEPKTQSIYAQRPQSMATRSMQDTEKASVPAAAPTIETNVENIENVAEHTGGNTANQTVRPVVTSQNRPVSPVKEKKHIPAGVWLFGIGILLVLTAGAIFATTTWAILPAFGKIAVLMLTVLVFYAGAYIAQRKLDLKNTSITFYILGSTFMAVINLAAGYFGWYGDYYSTSSGGMELIWSLSALITAACMIVGGVLYKTRVLGILGYFFMLLTVILGADFAFDSVVKVATCIGVTLIATQAYVCLAENRRGQNIIGTSHDVMCYLFAVYAFLVTFIGGNDSEKAAMLVLAIIALVLAGFRTLLDYRNEQSRFKLVGIIATGLAIMGLGLGIRYAEYYYQRFEIALVIYVLIYVVLIILKQKEVYDKLADLCVSIFAEITVILALIAQYMVVFEEGTGVNGIGVIILAAILYGLEHLKGENRIAILSALVFYLGGLSEITKYWELSTQNTITMIEIAIVAISLIAGRVIYKKVVSRSEKGVLIDWLSIGSFPIMLILFAQYAGNQEGEFVMLTLGALYIASYYKRQNWITDRIILTIAIIWQAMVIGYQPFYEINNEIIAEWWIAVSLMATGLIAIVWRRYSKAYSFVWVAVTMLCFMAEWTVIFSDGHINNAIIRMVVYLVGVVILVAIAFIRKNKVIMAEAGVALLIFSGLAYGVDTRAVFIVSMVLAAGYFILMHYENMSALNFLPVAQLQIILMAFEPNQVVWLFIFVALVVVSYVLHRVWDVENHIELSDDYLGFSAIIPVIAVWDLGGDKWAFIGTMMLALFVLSFYKRYSEDGSSIINRVILTVASVIIALGWITQPFVEMSGLAHTEWVIVAFMAVCVFNMLVVYRQDTDELWGWITFGAAIICIIVQAQCAIADGEIMAALILGIVMLVVLIWAYATRRKQWFILAAITLIAQCIYASREFWTSIAWWVYLLVAGAALIAIAARSEYKKRLGTEEKIGPNKHFLEGWRL